MASVCLTEGGDCLCDLGRLDEAAEQYEQRIIVAQGDVDDRRGVAVAQGQLATVRMLQRNFPAALKGWHDARKTFEDLDDPGGVATAWHQIGRVHEEARQLDQAEVAYKQSLAINQARGNRAGAASTLTQLGNVANLAGRLEESVAWERRALEIFVSLGPQAARVLQPQQPRQPPAPPAPSRRGRDRGPPGSGHQGRLRLRRPTVDDLGHPARHRHRPR